MKASHFGKGPYSGQGPVQPKEETDTVPAKFKSCKHSRPELTDWRHNSLASPTKSLGRTFAPLTATGGL